MWWVLVSLLLIWSSEAGEASVSVSCKDENNNDIDWYILYKAPKSQQLTGLEYIYIDSSGKRVMSSPPINDSNGALANTLRPMLATNLPDSFGFLSYSDQPPNCNAPSKFGHSKGVVLGDSGTETALWLTHSTPQFPFSRDQNKFWPSSGINNGQTFMCVSLPFSQLNSIGKHLQYISAYTFDKEIPSGFPKELIDAANKITAQPPGNFQSLVTRAGRELKMMAKKESTDVNVGDLYVALAAGFGSDMNAQTWGCQQGRDQSFCETNKHKVMNVEEIQTDLGQWFSTKDHSKWAVTTAENIAWTCISDVNRALSQYKRFGGALCVQDKAVNKIFKDFVKNTLQCRKRPRECTDDERDISYSSLFSGVTCFANMSLVSCATAVFFSAFAILLSWS